MRHVFETMGTIASIELPGEPLAELAAPLSGIEDLFSAAEQRFSLYRADSELSLIAHAAMSLADSSEAMRGTYARALEWRAQTGGFFSPHRPDGVLDLNGIVKAEAIERAGAYLDQVGLQRWTINVGGDILTRTDDEPWIIGISDPADARRVVCSLPISAPRRAVATSGSAQRGDHIWRSGLPGGFGPAEFIQVSVIADDIVTADVLATAIVAGGAGVLDEVADRWPIDVLAVRHGGEFLATPGFQHAMAIQ